MFQFFGKMALAAFLPALFLFNPIMTGMYPRHVAPRNPFEVSLNGEDLQRYMNREWRRHFKKQGIPV